MSIREENGRRKTVLAAARLLIGAAIIVFLLKDAEIDFAELARGEVAAALGLAALLIAAALLVSAIRWKLVLGPHSPSVLSLYRIYLIGWFFSQFLPTSIGGDAVRAVAVARSGTGAGATLSSIVVERVLGVGAMGVYLVLGVVLVPAVLDSTVGQTRLTLSPNVIAAGLLVGGLLFGGVLVLATRSERLRRLVRDALRLLDEFRRAPKRFTGAVVASLGVQGLYVLVWLQIARGFGLEVPALPFLVYVPFVSLAAMLPITLSGLGIREGSWVILLAPYGIATGAAVTFSLAYYIASLGLGVVGGVAFSLSGIRVRDIHADQDVSRTEAPVHESSSF